MSKKTKIWLIIASSLVLVGCAIFGGVMTIYGWDFTKLSTVDYETNNYEVGENYKNISIVTNTADILLLPSEDSRTSVICYEQSNMKHIVTVKDGALAIKISDARKWYEYIGIDFGAPKITVYIPQGEYGALSVRSSTGDIKISKEFQFQSIDILESTGDVTNYASALEGVKIKTGTGDICVENVSAKTLELSVSTGGITVSDVTCEGDVKITVSTGKTNITDTKCKNLISSGGTGRIFLKNVIAGETFCIERDTGDVKLDGCDAAEIVVKTDTGDVTGTVLSEKVFIIKTSTGDVSVPKTMTGGKCEITTSTGDITISIQQ